MQTACQSMTTIYCGSIDFKHYIKKSWPGRKEFLSQHALTLVNSWGHSFWGPNRVLVGGGSEGMNPSIYGIPSPWEQEGAPGIGYLGCERVVTFVYRLITGPAKPVNSLSGLDFSCILLG